jgi:hypothetical protein
MFVLDSLLIGGLRFVLDKIAAAAEAESLDDAALRQQLLEAQMQLELGEISEGEFTDIERHVLARLRELRSDRPAGLAIPADMKIAGVEATVTEE